MPDLATEFGNFVGGAANDIYNAGKDFMNSYLQGSDFYKDLQSVGNKINSYVDQMVGNAKELNDFNMKQIEEQRAYEKMMSDTAVQRRVADIKAAGLNPWLALNGGSLGEASTPATSALKYDSSSETRTTRVFTSVLSAAVGAMGDLLSSASKLMTSGASAGGKAAGTIIKALL